MSAAASIPKRTARYESGTMSRVAMKRTEKKYDETIREKKRENERERAEERLYRVLCESGESVIARLAQWP